MANGISRLKISTYDVKKHVTAISYVTKQNEDCETQLVDLIAGAIEVKHKIDTKKITNEEVSEFDKEMLQILNKKLFVVNANGRDLRKKELYEAITAYVKYP